MRMQGLELTVMGLRDVYGCEINPKLYREGPEREDNAVRL